jgi:hypothetical protein
MHLEVETYIEDFMAVLNVRNPGEKEFHQAVHEVVESFAQGIV